MTTDLIKGLFDRRMRAVEQAREIAERAAAGTELSAEDEAAYTKANEDISKLGQLIKDEQTRARDEAEFAEGIEAANRAAGTTAPPKSTPDKPASWVEQMRAAIGRGEQRQGGEDVAVPELRTLLEGSSTHGPETIPETLASRLLTKLFDDSAILSAGPTVFRTTDGNTIKFPRLATIAPLSMANARRTEGATIQKTDPTFDQVEFDAYKYAQISQASREIIQDSVIDIQGLMGTVLGRNMANYLGYDLTAGSGVSQPNGILTLVPSANQVTSATGTAGKPDTIDALLDVTAKLKPTYRRGAKWLMHDQTTFVLRKFKLNTTTGANAYAWQPGLVPGGPDTFMGYPIVVDPNVPQCALDTLSIVFADFSMYWVRLVSSVRVEWSTEYAWDTDLVSVKAVLRADGDTIDDTAFAGLVGAGS